MQNGFGYNKEILDLLIKKKPEIEKKAKEEPLKIFKEEKEPVLDEDGQIPLADSRNVVRLSGIQVSENGQLTKTKYFSMLEIDHEQYADITFTPEEAKKINMSMRAMSTGLNAAIPLICTGSECPFASTCAYQQANKAPVGRGCLIEKQLILYWTEQYVEEFQVNFSSPTELRMVSELAEFDIYEMRITKYLAEKHPTLLQDVVSFDAMGNQVINLEISKAFDLKERLKRNRMKVLEALLATRKDKAKIMSEVIKGGSTADKISELKNKIDALKNEVGKMDYIDADFQESKK